MDYRKIFRQQEVGSAVIDLAAATGQVEFKAIEKVIKAARGDNKALLIYGIDLSGIDGKEARLDSVIKELKSKFVVEGD